MYKNLKKRPVVIGLICFMHMLFWGNAYGQTFSANMQAAYEACLSMRKAIGSGSQTSLRAANEAFAVCETKTFEVLRCLTPDPLPLDGHFVFDEAFVDDLIEGRDVYKFAQRYAKREKDRGTSSSGQIFDKTCAVRSLSSVKYSFPSKGLQELAVVTEPGGLITLRIYDKTNDKWYNDTEDVKTGRESRWMIMNLPENKRSVLEIEIINTVDKDISFVILSN